MNANSMKKWLSFILCVALIAAIALTAMGCTDTNPETPETSGDTTVTTAESGTTAETPDPNAPTVKGEGATVFYFNVVDNDGKETKFEIHTDKTTVGEALLELGLIEGDMGDYGLYVKKVNGITAEYEVDGTYWAFYIGDDYGMTGVDMTDIEPGATYAFKVSK
jgi:ABC-type transport system substrate-binding protein